MKCLNHIDWSSPGFKDCVDNIMDATTLLKKSKDLLTMVLTFIPEKDAMHYYRVKIGIAEIEDFLIVKDPDEVDKEKEMMK